MSSFIRCLQIPHNGSPRFILAGLLASFATGLHCLGSGVLGAQDVAVAFFLLTCF